MVDNLDSHLMPEGSPIQMNQGQVSSYQFDYQNEQGVISSAKIKQAAIGSAQIGSISFSNISGGTAMLGGVGPRTNRTGKAPSNS